MFKWHYRESKHRTPEREKVFAYHISDKCLVYRIYKENLPLNNKKKTFQLKYGQIIYRYFTKEHLQMANKYVKRCSILLGKHKSKPQCYTTSFSLDKN